MTPRLVRDMFEKAETVQSLVPVIPCTDTLKVLQKEGEELKTVEGVVADRSMLYAAQTLIGSAQMLVETGEHPGKLKDAVCSPAGSTIEGVKALEEGSFRASAMNAVKKAYERTKELSQIK